MMLTREYEYLTWLVQFRNEQGWFETIAAFNSDRVAVEYAKECHRVNFTRAYRVLERNDNDLEWKTLATFGAAG